MNRFYTLLAVVLLALAAPCRTLAAAPAPDDTIVVKLPNQATMTLFVKNKAQLRELRNYGLHPRAEVSSDLEHHFTEHAASLTFMASHRYFMRLAAIAASLAGAA